MNQQNDDSKQGGSNIAAAVGAAVIGAAVGATAAYLSDQENRKKVVDTAMNAKDSASKMANDLAKKTDNLIGDANDKIDQLKSE